MEKYRIFAGLAGGFGGAQYQYTEEFESEDEANDAAYVAACEIYDSQEGCGMDGWEDFLDEARLYIIESDFNDDDEEYEEALNEYASELSNEARERWIDYYVILVGSEEDTDPEQYED